MLDPFGDGPEGDAGLVGGDGEDADFGELLQEDAPPLSVGVELGFVCHDLRFTFRWRRAHAALRLQSAHSRREALVQRAHTSPRKAGKALRTTAPSGAVLQYAPPLGEGARFFWHTP